MQPDGDTTAQGGGASPKPTSVLRSAAFMSLGTLVSRILGLVRDLALAALFPRVITDAYVVAFRLPNLFRRILGEGSLAASFVPLYVEGREKDIEKARSLANSVFSLLALTTASLSALGVIYMDQVMGFLVSGEAYQSVEGKAELTVHMGRIMFSFLFLVMNYAFLMSVLNAHKKFFLPALAPALLNVAIIVSCFMPSVKMEGDQLAYGVLVGGVMQLLMVVGPLIRLGEMPIPTTRFFHKTVFVFFRNLIPSMIGMSVLQLLAIINVNLASRLPQGSHTYIYLADRLLEFPASLLSVSLSVALLPTLSELFARGQKADMAVTVHKHIRMLLVLSLPSAVGLFMLGYPLVNMVFGRGEFSAYSVARTSEVLQVYAFVLIFSGTHRIIVPAFYAMKNTWLPALISSFCVVIHYFVASWAVGLGGQHLGISGLMGLILATAFTGLLNLLLITIAFKVYFKDLGVLSVFKSVLHLTPALMAMAAFLHYGSPMLIEALGKYLGTTIVIGAAVVIYFATNKLTKHPEANEVLRKLTRSR